MELAAPFEYEVGAGAFVDAVRERQDAADLVAREFGGDAQAVGAIDRRLARVHRVHGGADRAPGSGEKEREQDDRKHHFEQGETG